jgi:hypothetical protein
MAKFKIEINSKEKLEGLLQESYDLATSQIKTANDEISKLSNSCILKDYSMDEKSKYYKAINDLMVIKDKAISRKIEISKLLSEILKYNGDINEALNNENIKSTTQSFNFDSIRDAIEKESSNKTETYKVR